MSKISGILHDLKTYTLEPINHFFAWPTAPAVIRLELSILVLIARRIELQQKIRENLRKQKICTQGKVPKRRKAVGRDPSRGKHVVNVAVILLPVANVF